MKTSATILETNSMHSALATAGRSHEIPEALDAYGWLIGSWELELVGYDDEGNVMHTTGGAHFAWVLEGRAVQDVFINPRRSDRGPDSPEIRQLGWHNDSHPRSVHSSLAGELVQPTRRYSGTGQAEL